MPEIFLLISYHLGEDIPLAVAAARDTRHVRAAACESAVRGREAAHLHDY